MDDVILDIRNVSHTFQGLEVLKNLSFVLRRQESLSILGPSGCGKSTLMNIVSGLIKPDLGNVFMAGKCVTGVPGTIAHMHQKDLLLPWKSVLENAALPLLLKGRKKKQVSDEVQPLLDTFGLQGFEHYFPSQLSGGMRQRVALLRTWLYGKNLLVLDEPMGALDAITRRRMQLWLLSLTHVIKSAMLLVTHDIDEALILSDRIIVLSERPAGIRGVFKVPFAHPFERQLMLEPQYTLLKEQLWQALQ